MRKEKNRLTNQSSRPCLFTIDRFDSSVFPGLFRFGRFNLRNEKMNHNEKINNKNKHTYAGIQMKIGWH
jgi:hypothetical protein